MYAWSGLLLARQIKRLCRWLEGQRSIDISQPRLVLPPGWLAGWLAGKSEPGRSVGRSVGRSTALDICIAPPSAALHRPESCRTLCCSDTATVPAGMTTTTTMTTCWWESFAKRESLVHHDPRPIGQPARRCVYVAQLHKYSCYGAFYEFTVRVVSPTTVPKKVHGSVAEEPLWSLRHTRKSHLLPAGRLARNSIFARSLTFGRNPFHLTLYARFGWPCLSNPYGRRRSPRPVGCRSAP